jgi:hypothetical protein
MKLIKEAGHKVSFLIGGKFHLRHVIQDNNYKVNKINLMDQSINSKTSNKHINQLV